VPPSQIVPRQPYIGGQAVIEGVMMRSPRSFVIAVRRHRGGIAIREQAWETLWPRLPFLRWPLFRGAVVLLESLHNGFSALKFSSDHALPPEDGGQPPKVGVAALLAGVLASLGLAADGQGSPGDHPAPAKRSGGDFLLITAMAMMAVVFIAIPHGLTWLVGRAVGPGFDTTSVWFHLVDGIFRIGILVGYLALLSRAPDARRLFEYHGAEHKSIWAYELYRPLTVESAQTFTTKHPRCGTSFLFIVVGVAVLLHVALLPFVPRLHPNDLVNQLLMVLVKVPMAFPIAGVAYELQRWSARDGAPGWVKALTRPGLWLQNITTREPAADQLEVALLSLDRALAREEGHPRSPDGVTLYETFAEASGAPAPAA
jgi:uncharacterized protein YqhQ